MELSREFRESDGEMDGKREYLSEGRWLRETRVSDCRVSPLKISGPCLQLAGDLDALRREYDENQEQFASLEAKRREQQQAHESRVAEWEGIITRCAKGVCIPSSFPRLFTTHTHAYACTPIRVYTHILFAGS